MLVSFSDKLKKRQSESFRSAIAEREHDRPDRTGAESGRDLGEGRPGATGQGHLGRLAALDEIQVRYCFLSFGLDERWSDSMSHQSRLTCLVHIVSYSR